MYFAIHFPDGVFEIVIKPFLDSGSVGVSVISAGVLNLLDGEVGGEQVADLFGEHLKADGVGRADIQCLAGGGIGIEKLGVSFAELSTRQSSRQQRRQR